jgi:uncharacterized protein (TIGR03067 family)
MQSALLIGLALTVAAPAPKETPKKEAPGIIGSWSLEKAELGGMALPPAGAAAMGELSLKFNEDGTVVATKGGKAEPENTRYTHDAKKSPPEIDITEGRGGGKDMIIKGIYKIEGETLTLCMSPLGERPTKFESPAGAQIIMMTFKRIKKD